MNKKMKLYKKLPIIYLITFPFYMFAGMLMIQLTGVAGYLLSFWFNPVLRILAFIDNIIRLSFSFRNIAVIFISNLVFWFLVGLLIDKIIHRVKNGKWQTADSNLNFRGNFLFLLGITMLSAGLICQFIIVGIDPFATLSLPITFLSLYIIPVVFLFLRSVNWSFFKKILVMVLFIIYLVALARLLTFFETGDLIIRDNILRFYSTLNFSRNSEYGVILTRSSISEKGIGDRLYLFDISKKSLNPISIGIPITSNHAYFSPNGDKILYEYGRQEKAVEFAKGAPLEGSGLKVFNIINGENDEIISFLGEYSFENTSKYYDWFQKGKPYLYGWIDENKIAFSCTKKPEIMMNGGRGKPEALYCVYDSNAKKVYIVENRPKLFDGNLPVFNSSDIVNYRNSPESIPNSNNKIGSKRILHGLDGSTAVEVYIIDISRNKKVIYRGHGFDNGSIYVTSNGDLLIKKDYKLLKIN